MLNLFGGQGMETIEMNLRDALGGMFTKRERRKLTVREARKLLEAEEVERLVDRETVEREAVERAQESGIVFLDEIDKIASRGSGGAGPDVSREGVQRDLLPLVEGTTVNTRYGPVATDHVLFIAAGAFHVAKPSDLIPELQGRFPVRVQLDPLSEADLARILTEPEHAILKQHQALLGAEGVELEVTADGVARAGADRRGAQPQRREHRRPPAHHGARAGARGDLVHRAGAPRKPRGGRRRQGAGGAGAAARRTRTSPATCCSGERARWRSSVRATERLAAMRIARVAVAPGAAARLAMRWPGAGARRPPLPPIIEVPETTTDLTAYQDGNEVVLTWSYPQLTRGGPTLTDLARVEVWRLEVPPGQEQVGGRPGGRGAAAPADARPRQAGRPPRGRRRCRPRPAASSLTYRETLPSSRRAPRRRRSGTRCGRGARTGRPRRCRTS